jgi:hypothetical protein
LASELRALLVEWSHYLREASFEQFANMRGRIELLANEASLGS